MLNVWISPRTLNYSWTHWSFLKGALIPTDWARDCGWPNEDVAYWKHKMLSLMCGAHITTCTSLMHSYYTHITSLLFIRNFTLFLVQCKSAVIMPHSNCTPSENLFTLLVVYWKKFYWYMCKELLFNIRTNNCFFEPVLIHTPQIHHNGL